MLSRATLIVLTLFWLAMNVLLWRAEYGGRHSAGSAVPAPVVWQKILTAPDSSSLTVLHHGQKIGFCHWVTSVGEELSLLNEGDVPAEGLVGRVRGYRLHLEGNLALEDKGSRIRFDSNLKLTTNQLWQEFSIRLNLRPTVVEIHSSAAEKTVHLQAGEGAERVERVIKFSELQNPGALIAQFGGPLVGEIWSNLGSEGGGVSGGSLASGLDWEARNDSIQIGHAQVKAYRLQANVLNRYQAVIFVSRVGEILRVELPDDFLLVNDQLANF